MEKIILDTIQKYSMLQPGQLVIVALSGGADSVALFDFFVQNQDALHVRVQAAHFEHGMRGQSSLLDAAFVAELCAKRGIACHVGHGNMHSTPRPAAMSEEEWARKLRYGFLEGLAQQHNAKIATAHNLGDNAETVLFHAIRGAGTKGLAGIPPVRGVFIRPLLYVQRAQIEAYCTANGLAYCVDETNADMQYARNRLRLEVLPQLEQIHAGATKALARLSIDMRTLDTWLQNLANELLVSALGQGQQPPQQPQGWCNPQKSWAFTAEPLQAAPEPVLLKALALLAGASATRENLYAMQQVLAGTSRGANVRHGRRFYISGGFAYLEPQLQVVPASQSRPLAPGEIDMGQGYVFRVQVLSKTQADTLFTNSPQKSDEKGLNFLADYDKLDRNSVFRTRLPGDVYCLPGRNVTKSLKKWMNEAGFSHQMRAALPLLAAGSKVFWVYGNGFAHGLRVTSTTSTVLLIQQIKGNG